MLFRVTILGDGKIAMILMLKDWLLKVSLSFPRPTRTRKVQAGYQKTAVGERPCCCSAVPERRPWALNYPRFPAEEIRPDDIELVGIRNI